MKTQASRWMKWNLKLKTRNQANASEEFIINRLEEMSDREGKVDEMDQPGKKKKRLNYLIINASQDR